MQMIDSRRIELVVFRRVPRLPSRLRAAIILDLRLTHRTLLTVEIDIASLISLSTRSEQLFAIFLRIYRASPPKALFWLMIFLQVILGVIPQHLR